MTKLAVDIWSDIMCPWCAIGLTSLLQAVEQVADDVEVELVAMPFQLAPNMPEEGREQAAHLTAVYGKSPDEVAAMRSQMEAVAATRGFAMDYAGEGEPPAAMMWNTAEAHRLLRWALANSGPSAQIRLKQALFRAHFQQRLPIGQREILLDIAADEGFDRAEANAALDDPALATAVEAEEARGRQAGITSVPSFVVHGRYILQGAQDADGFAKALLQSAIMEAAA